MLTDMIDELNLFISSNEAQLTIAGLRPKLQALRDQAETQEAQMRHLEEELQDPELERKCKGLEAELKLANLEIGSLSRELELWRNADSGDNPAGL
jgi:chromosome segregation ATPase